MKKLTIEQKQARIAKIEAQIEKTKERLEKCNSQLGVYQERRAKKEEKAMHMKQKKSETCEQFERRKNRDIQKTDNIISNKLLDIESLKDRLQQYNTELKEYKEASCPDTTAVSASTAKEVVMEAGQVEVELAGEYNENSRMKSVGKAEVAVLIKEDKSSSDTLGKAKNEKSNDNNYPFDLIMGEISGSEEVSSKKDPFAGLFDN